MNSVIKQIGVLTLVLLLALPHKAHAQCELDASPEAAANGVIAAETAYVNTMVLTLKAQYLLELTVAQELLVSEISSMGFQIMDKLNWLWQVWYQTLRDMTKQIATAYVDESRQIAGFHDANSLTAVARVSQSGEADAKKIFTPTRQACQFDTSAKYLARSETASQAIAKGYAADFNKIGSTQKGTAAATGQAALQQSRWQAYQSKYCDVTANNGSSGCASTLLAEDAKMAVLPSRTLFGKETVDLSNADTREGISQLMFNITGYKAPDPVATTALANSPYGLQTWQKNREYTAQMDAIGALAYSVVADRAAGAPAPEIKAMRLRMGVTDASDKPSKREIRQAIIEQIQDPNYYKELYDNPNTIGQKALYLKAYSLVMLYDIISKQEKISNAYAIETANLLHAMETSSRNSASDLAPVK